MNVFSIKFYKEKLFKFRKRAFQKRIKKITDFLQIFVANKIISNDSLYWKTLFFLEDYLRDQIIDFSKKIKVKVSFNFFLLNEIDIILKFSKNVRIEVKFSDGEPDEIFSYYKEKDGVKTSGRLSCSNIENFDTHFRLTYEQMYKKH